MHWKTELLVRILDIAVSTATEQVQMKLISIVMILKEILMAPRLILTIWVIILRLRLAPNVVPPGAEGNDITCTTCHGPNSEENHAQLRMPLDEICEKCHNPEFNPDNPEPDGSNIYHSTAFMFEGKGGWEYDGVTYESSVHTFAIADKCVSRHVY